MHVYKQRKSGWRARWVGLAFCFEYYRAKAQVRIWVVSRGVWLIRFFTICFPANWCGIHLFYATALDPPPPPRLKLTGLYTTWVQGPVLNLLIALKMGEESTCLWTFCPSSPGLCSLPFKTLPYFHTLVSRWYYCSKQCYSSYSVSRLGYLSLG